MTVVLIVAIALGAAGAYWLTTRRPSPPPAERTAAPPSKTGGRFSGVEIRTRGSACRAARALHGQRFLSKDAPPLPLAGCTFAQCSCTFSKLKDRRTEGRRLDHGALSASLFLATNRRTKKDRRRAAARQQRT